MPPAASLYVGRTVHARETPFAQSFSYKIAMVDIDIDRLDEAANHARLFSIDKPNVSSLRQRDFGSGGKTSLRGWAVEQLFKADIELNGGAIRMVTFPRILGYSFSPITLWFGYGPDDDLRGVIYEVHNTFGERHSYVGRTPAEVGRIRQSVDKNFHVSPFFDIEGRYRFTLHPPEDRLNVVIETLTDTGRSHTASIVAKRQKLTDFQILACLAKMPFMAHGVTAGIHWEALKLWLKGAGYRPKPPLPKQNISVATLETASAQADNAMGRHV
ncbi:MAG: DUF1365 domain-containing protein [Pseudomonadota bacterium]